MKQQFKECISASSLSQGMGFAVPAHLVPREFADQCKSGYLFDTVIATERNEDKLTIMGHKAELDLPHSQAVYVREA